ncbi:MAG TPA: M20/M25/M40 family metallo-hydrolase [Ktedonobacterales bacterium]
MSAPEHIATDVGAGKSGRIWYDEVRRYTHELVTIRGVSPSRDENATGAAIHRLLSAALDGNASAEAGFDAIPGDPWERANVWGVVPGASSKTVVLMGHFDTVGTEDYGALEAWSLDPDGIVARLDTLSATTPGLAADLATHPGDWMFGRGVADMKSGVAICIALMRHYAALAREGRLPLTIVMIATPDEENESAGARQAARFLAGMRQSRGLTYAGAINTDFVTARFPDDDKRPVYTGSIGKLLPCFFLAGRASHAGEPFAGVDANLLLAALVSEFDMNPSYCERVRGQTTPPPVTLRATDTKSLYNTQIPTGATLYLNLLTMERTPGEALAMLRAGAEDALARALARVSDAAGVWEALHGSPPPGWSGPLTGSVLSWAELRAEVAARLGEETLATALSEEWSRWPAEVDKRTLASALVQRLWTLSGREGPAAVLYFAPPWYPATPAVASPLLDALRAVLAARPHDSLVEEEYFPLLSDMSYLRLDPAVDPTAIREQTPTWRDQPADGALPSGAYGLPLEAMRALDMPVIDIGPYGRDAHQRGERALASFSFEIAPQVIAEVIAQLAERLGAQD